MAILGNSSVIVASLLTDLPITGDGCSVGQLAWITSESHLYGWNGTIWDNSVASLIGGIVSPLQLGAGVPSAANFLRGDSTWQVVAGGSTPTGTGFEHVTGGVEDAASKLVETADVSNDQITYAKIQNVSATDRLLGRSTAGAGDVEEITCTAAGRALIDDADAATQRTTLGLVAVASSGSAADLSTGILLDARMPDLTGDVTTVEGAVATTIAALAVTDAKVATANKDGLAATPSMRTLGTGAQVACAGNDARLSDARTPTVHATSHKLAGSDVLLLNEFGSPTGSVQFAQQESLQFRLENRTSDPSSPATGECWLRTDL